MDPNATLRELLIACDDGDRDTAIECLDNLKTWITGGGFLPANFSCEILDYHFWF